MHAESATSAPIINSVCMPIPPQPRFEQLPRVESKPLYRALDSCGFADQVRDDLERRSNQH